MTERLEPRRLLTFAVDSAVFDVSGAEHAFEIELSADLDQTTLDDGDVMVENLSTRLYADETLTGMHGWGLTYDNATKTIRIDPGEANAWADGYLPDGNYEVTLWADGLSDTTGNTLTKPDGTPLHNGVDPQGAPAYRANATTHADFFFLNGDFNRDRVVDLADFGIHRAHFLTGTTFAQSDANGDGMVDLADFGIMRDAFGTNLDLPPTAAGEVVADQATSSTVEVSWQVPADPASYDGFRIYRAEGTPDGFQLIAEVFPTAGDINDGITGWQDTGLVDGTRYHYDVRAFTHAAGDSPRTDDAAAWTTLLPPEDVVATFLSEGDVLVSWDLGGYTQSDFFVEYSTDGGANWSPAGTVDGWQSYLVIDDSSGVPGTKAQRADYQYRVRGQLFDAAGVLVLETSPSLGVEPELESPTALSATSPEPGLLELAWSNDAYVQTLHRVEVSSDGGAPWLAVADRWGEQVASGFDDEFVIAGTPDGFGGVVELADNAVYDLRVRSELALIGYGGFVFDVVETSEWVELGAGVGGSYVPVLAPSGVNAIAESATSIRVEWSDESSGESGYAVERRPENDVNGWVAVGTVGPDAQSFVDTSITSVDDVFVYRVRATATPPFAADGSFDSLPVDDRNSVSTSETEGEHIGYGSWSGFVGDESSVEVKVLEMNSPHGYIVVRGMMDTLTFPYEELSSTASAQERQELESYAEGLVGLQSWSKMTLNGNEAFTTTTTVESILTEAMSDGTYRVSLTLVDSIESDVAYSVVSGDTYSFSVPSQDASATAIAASGGSLLAAVKDDPEFRFASSSFAILTDVYPVDATVNLSINGFDELAEERWGGLIPLNWDNDNGSDVTENWSSKKDFEVSSGEAYTKINPNDPDEKPELREDDLRPLGVSVGGLPGKDENADFIDNVQVTIGGGGKIRAYFDQHKTKPFGGGKFSTEEHGS
ncbi:MAG: hypothetical protein AAGI46_13735, partial [Planctomycetota bacterium]